MTQEPKIPTAASSAARQQQSPEPYNPFNMRLVMLQNLYNWQCANKLPSRSLNMSVQRNKHFAIQSPDKTLDLLRQVVQNSINKELDTIIQHYMQKFFAPAIVNIRRNGSDVSDEQIHSVCRQILEEAKKMYLIPLVSVKENEYFLETASTKTAPPPQKIVNKNIPQSLRVKKKERVESDSESDVSSQVSSIGGSGFQRKKPKVDRSSKLGSKVSATYGTPKQLDIPFSDVSKWHPDRVTDNSLFVLGSKANSALGLSAQRGRIYIKHPGLFRYITDTDDKQWLFENKQKAVRAGGKSFLLLYEDIKQLAETNEYKSNPAVTLDGLHAFVLPNQLIEKIKMKTAAVYDELCQKFGLLSEHTSTGTIPTYAIENVTSVLSQETSTATDLDD